MDTTDWASQLGPEYRSVLLGHATQEGYDLTGMAVLITNPKKAFEFPAETVEIVSSSLLESGDVVKVYSAS